jgi:hypothetical protein
MKLTNFLSLFIVFFFITSCVEDEDFELPDITVVDPNIVANMTFQNVMSKYGQAISNEDGIAVFDEDQNLYIEGYVISSDKAGNFFKELIIQNKIDGNSDTADPRLGFKVEVNVKSLANTYEVGRKVYIKMNGLAVGLSHGVFVIGKQSGNNIEPIQEFEFKDYIIRDPEIAILTPKITTLGELTEQDKNTLIQLDNIQVHRHNIAQSYAGEPFDEFDGFRTLESCDDGGSISLQTSTFSDFKSLQIPQNKGSIQGVFSRDFKDDFNVLIINSTSDINFDNTERCDPIILECEGTTAATITIFNEGFQSIQNEDDLDALGWTNINVSGGSERYEDSSFAGDTYLKISAFGTGESPLEAWLITPAINLDGSSEEQLSFDISANFETGQALTAFITDNYTGDPTTTEWTQLDANIPIGGSSFGSFITSTINISCLSGNIHVAFQYLGAAGGAETRYHIDNIKVTGSN